MNLSFFSMFVVLSPIFVTCYYGYFFLARLIPAGLYRHTLVQPWAVFHGIILAE